MSKGANRGAVTCVFVHGWAMNSVVWEGITGRLPDWLDVICIDLPGHGSMAGVSAASLDDYVQSLHPLVHRPVLWVGWSLGGLAVLRLAELYPQRVAAAMLVATNPCFVTRPDWQCAVDAAVFTSFSDELNHDQAKTMRRFLALQVKGLDGAMAAVRRLQSSIEKRGQATKEALNAGLDMLLYSDFRHTIRSIECPLSWYLGARDSLVPSQLARVLSEDFAQADVYLHPQASHAPFISHSEDFAQRLISMAEPYR